MIAVLATRIISPNIMDWKKLVRTLKYLNGTKKYHLNLSMYDMVVIKWCVNALFEVHPNSKTHTGGIIM